MTLDFIRISPKTKQKPAALIVTLHGCGANAQDVESLSSYFNLPDCEFLFPNAPYPYPYSPVGRAWYDLRDENMYQGLPESRQLLIDWLQSLESMTGVPLSRTVLSGFSQGGAMTLDVGLTLPLAGLVVMSGYPHPQLANLQKGNFPPTLIMHGTQDQVVPLSAATKAKAVAEALGVVVEYHEFVMGHEINLEMLQVLRKFVIKTIADG
ncbi:alpha/beta hydrolase [Anabaena aphanizomenioides LEGE 00250]|jgi:phospholipase/carboxylesterase|uniref:Alpha/beta hydrolase n=1 Tax=Sphaerospermopsis aphanizomenoides LEGE 00250 TaxID=2777972 RepID=A0ABR9VKI2_9CYAN|nr:alpha/beta hydrolase [Sphaerospermopsis aphanizomenoides]MBE9239006.1 alpha/beta hydrolase [Sphaerospermopsis aphanizomenoides LEGE 00250]